MVEQSRRKLALVTNKNLDSLGGQEQGIKYLLGFNANWTFISPYLPPEPLHPEEILQTKKDFVIPGVREHIVRPKEMQIITARLRETNPEEILIDGTGIYGISVFMQLPQGLQQKTYAIWRNIINAPFSISHDSAGIRMLRRVHRKAQAHLMKHVKANLAVSQAVAQSLREIGIPENKIMVIPQQIGKEVSLEQRMHDQQQSEYQHTVRAEFFDADELGILFVGRIVPEKGLDWVVDLYEQLRSERKHVLQNEGSFKKVKLTIVGPLPGRDQSFFSKFIEKMERVTMQTNQEYASDSITYNYVGPKSKKELQRYYNVYDILFMPSYNFEGFGRTTAEAMMGGMTVIGRRDTLATRELLSQAPNMVGVLVNIPQEAGAEIINFMQRPERLAEFKYNALLWGNGYFSLHRAEQGLWYALEQSSVSS